MRNKRITETQQKHTLKQIMESETSRLKSALYITGSVGSGTMGVMAIINFKEHELFFTILLATIAGLVALSLVTLKLFNTIKLTSFIFSACIIFLSGLLIYTGGVRNNGPLWIFIFYPLLFIINHAFKGLLFSFSIIFFQIIFLFTPLKEILRTQYSSDVTTRYIISESAVILIIFASEWTRKVMNDKIKDFSKKLRELSRTDELTDLHNRRGGLEKIEIIHSLSARNGHPFAIILIDLDHFKDVNDNYGHNHGDSVLQKIGVTIKDQIRVQDAAIRWGGEEFLIMLPDTDLIGAGNFSERLKKTISQTPIEYQGVKINITASFGVIESSGDEKIDAAIARADRALYEAKKKRNSIILR